MSEKRAQEAVDRGIKARQDLRPQIFEADNQVAAKRLTHEQREAELKGPADAAALAVQDLTAAQQAQSALTTRDHDLDVAIDKAADCGRRFLAIAKLRENNDAADTELAAVLETRALKDLAEAEAVIPPAVPGDPPATGG